MRLLRQDDGQTSVEYGLVLLMVAIMSVTVLAGVVGPARAFFESIPDLLPL